MRALQFFSFEIKCTLKMLDAGCVFRTAKMKKKLNSTTSFPFVTFLVLLWVHGWEKDEKLDSISFWSVWSLLNDDRNHILCRKNKNCSALIKFLDMCEWLDFPLIILDAKPKKVFSSFIHVHGFHFTMIAFIDSADATFFLPTTKSTAFSHTKEISYN